MKRRNIKKCKQFRLRRTAVQSDDIYLSKYSEEALLCEQSDLQQKQIHNNISILKESRNTNQSIWNLKKVFFPKNQQSIPIAKKNLSGRLISNTVELRNVYLEQFILRLRNRPIMPGMEDHQRYVESELQRILSETADVNILDWTMHDLERVLCKLKKNQSQDTMNMVNEIFRP